MYFYIKISASEGDRGSRKMNKIRICGMCPLPTELLRSEETSDVL